MEHPGPSQGDAFEFIESLGISPWQFEEIKLATEAVNGRMVTGTFEVVGTADLVLALLAAMLKSSA